MINYRNSCAYIAGVFIPFLSYYIFTHIEEDFDQFSYIANICAALGTISSVSFALIIHEPKLIKQSKAIYDKYFLIEEMKPNENGQALNIDEDDDFGTESSAP